MFYECDEASRIAFKNELSVIHSVLENYDVSHVIIGGDFNVDFNRDWVNTSVLRDFCTELNLYPVVDHRSSTIDYTYHFAMQRFHCVDHFIVSQQVFSDAVCNVSVDHSPDNTSDHDPIGMQLCFNVQRLCAQPRSFVPKVAWNKAKPHNLKSIFRNP